MNPEDTTEDSIIDQLDDDTLASTDPVGDTDAATTDQTPPDTQSTDVDAGTGQSDTVDPNAPATGQQQQQQQTGSSQTGDLIDATTGQVVARAGAERRMYENMQRANGEVTRLQGEVTRMQGQLAGVDQLQQLPQQLGLNNDQVGMAMQLMANYIKSPVETLKYMLTEAQTAGHNVDELGGNTVDMAAIGNMFDAKLKPILDDRAAVQRTQEANAQANTQANAFLAAHPDAVLHEAHIAALITRDPTLTPREAYLTLKMDAQTRNLNWAQPLEPQYRAQQGGNGQAPSTVSTLPIGKAGAAMQATTSQSAPITLDADADLDDIVGAALDEAGIIN